MTRLVTREYYKIRFPAKAGGWGEWHHSNNGTAEWGTLKQIKAILTRGIQCGYKGRIHKPFEDFEVVKVVEEVNITESVVDMSEGK